MKLYAMTCGDNQPAAPWRFVTLEEMASLTLPTAVRKAVAVVRERLK